MTVALFCGARGWENRDCRDWLRERIRTELRALDPQRDRVIQGAAKGADKIADWEAMLMGFRTDSFPADWDRFKLGAGPERNGRMKDELVRAREAGEHVIVYAFHHDPGLGSGTADMVRQAAEAGITSKVSLYGCDVKADRDVSCLILHDGDRILLQHRSDDALRFPGMHGMFGGGLEPGESPGKALSREAREELGLELWPGEPMGTHLFRLPDMTMRIHAWVFDAKLSPSPVTPEALRASQGEGQGLGFYAQDEVDKLDVPCQDRAVLRLAFAQIRGAL